MSFKHAPAPNFSEKLSGITAYKNEEEFLNDLEAVLREEYEITLTNEKLKESSRNLNTFLVGCL